MPFTYEYSRPALTVDCVVFGLGDADELQVLLIRRTSARPRLHGLQVGVASYLVSRLQVVNSDEIAGLFDATGFWQAIVGDPFSKEEWLEAVRIAPTIKEGYYTVFSSRDVLPEVRRLLDEDPRLRPCFR